MEPNCTSSGNTMEMESKYVYKWYTRRWIFLVGLTVFQFFSGISFTSYGQISNFYVQFFNASHAEVDWITNARNISAIFITIPLAFLIFKGKVGSRNMILIVACSSTIGLLLVTLSLVDRSLFPLIVLGQILCGLAETISLAVPSTFAVLWFPESQVGTAIALNVLGISIGDGTGYVLPAYLVPSSNQTWTNGRNLSQSELTSGQSKLRYMYGSFLGISAVVTILFAIFVTDKPPTPPTLAQDLKTENHAPKKLIDFLKETKLLFTNWSYVLTCIIIGLEFQMVLVENMLMSEIIADMQITSDISFDQLSGYIMGTSSLGGLFGFFLGGKVVDRCKKYKVLAIFGISAFFVSTVAIAVSFVFKNIAGIYTSNGIYGFLWGLVAVILFEMATQLTYPNDETLVNTWMTAIQTGIALLLGVLGRTMFKLWGSLGVLSFQSAGIFVALILCCLVSPKNRRLEVKTNESNVHTRLIASK